MSDAAPVRGRWGRISSGEGTRARRDETRILVVEDSASARKLIQAILLRLGITLPELRLSGSVDEAMRLFTEWRPELVFLDLELRTTAARPAATGAGTSPNPPRDGTELAGVFLSRNPGLRVVLCSASDPSDPRIQALLKDPRVQYVLKPMVATRIQAALDTALPPSGARSSGR